MKVYLVNGWDAYYPDADSTVKVFRNEGDAKDYILSLVSLEKEWDRKDYYRIFEKEVE